MLAYIATWAALRTDSRAVTALEYAMIAGVVVAVIAVGFGTIGTDLAAKFTSIAGNLWSLKSVFQRLSTRVRRYLIPPHPFYF
jgi:pilus assembly protein Flp/PilA